MSFDLIEDSRMLEAPPLLDSCCEESAIPNNPYLTTQRPGIDRNVEQIILQSSLEGPDSSMSKVAARVRHSPKIGSEESQDISTENNISAGIDHLAISSTKTGFTKLSPEQFETRRENARKSQQKTGRFVTALPISSLRTGLCFDIRMRFHATLDEEDVHPEDPRRIHVIFQTLVDAGLAADHISSEESEDDFLIFRVKARQVTKEEVLLVHTLDHWQLLQATPEMTKEQLLEMTRIGDSVFYNQQSFLCARLSCGGAIESCKAVWTGLVKNAIAVIRPPGHHAEPHSPMGFCLFNNVAVAAKAMQQDYPNCKKILVLDWDVHHGNGTQTAFYDDKSVLYMSLHRFENGLFYPPSMAGDLNQCGEGEGLGFNVNIPWATGGICDADYVYAFQRVIMPIAYEYEPDLVIISAGFDAAAGDRIGECFVTPSGYAHMTHMLMSLANGRIAVCLEGGYNLDSISASALAVTQTLLGEPPGKLHSVHASQGVIQVVKQVIIEQSKYWKCMEYKSINKRLSTKTVKATRLHDVLRQYQSRNFFDRYRMSSLYIPRPTNFESPSFDEQVLATSKYDQAKVLVLVVHDPSEVVAVPEAGKDTIETHNSFVTDTSDMFIKWAVNEGYGVVDVSLPHFVTPRQDSERKIANPYIHDDSNNLVIHVWDNYIDLSDAENIILVGIGEAYRSILHLISLRDCCNRIAACTIFLGKISLYSVTTTRDEQVGNWYYKNSQVYVADSHDVWNQPKKPKQKYGCLVKVNEIFLENLVHSAFNSAVHFINIKLERSSAQAAKKTVL